MNISLFEQVLFVGPDDFCKDLRSGDVGYVIEAYVDGNYEVEFSEVDGTTRVQAVIPEKFLLVSER